MFRYKRKHAPFEVSLKGAKMKRLKNLFEIFVMDFFRILAKSFSLKYLYYTYKDYYKCAVCKMYFRQKDITWFGIKKDLDKDIVKHLDKKMLEKLKDDSPVYSCKECFLAISPTDTKNVSSG